MTRTRIWLGGLGLALAACTDPGVDPAEEVAAELRALRLQMAAQASVPPTTTSPGVQTPAIDPKELLQPLREVFAGLQQNQQELAARQTALAQEMQRWSQLLVTSLGEKHAEEGKAMAARIAALEQSLQQQETRHKEVESLLQGALERTADRLEQFLQRLPGGGGAEAAPSPTPDGGQQAPAANPAPAPRPANPTNGNGGGERPLAARSRGNSTRWWWLGITALGGSVAAFFLRRAWRLGGGAASEHVAPAAGRSAMPTAPAEQSVEELWATAALLGEAVERLRQQQAEPQSVESAPAIAAPQAPESVVEQLDLDDLFVLEDETPLAEPASEPSTPGPGVAEPMAPAPLPGPEFVTLRLAAAAAADVLAVLARTPFVLRRPAPAAKRVSGWLEVTFAVLPGTSAGDRARLGQALREAGR